MMSMPDGVAGAWVQGLMDTQKPTDMISGNMTGGTWQDMPGVELDRFACIGVGV